MIYDVLKLLYGLRVGNLHYSVACKPAVMELWASETQFQS
jgi:hypothetical protein